MNSDDLGVLTEAINEGEFVGLPEHDLAAICHHRDTVQERESLQQKYADLVDKIQKLDLEDPTNLEEMKNIRENLVAALKDGKRLRITEAELRPVDAQRKKLHNAIEDLKGTIRVFCRVRPISKTEKARGDESCVKCTDRGVEIDHEH